MGSEELVGDLSNQISECKIDFVENDKDKIINNCEMTTEVVKKMANNNDLSVNKEEISGGSTNFNREDLSVESSNERQSNVVSSTNDEQEKGLSGSGSAFPLDTSSSTNTHSVVVTSADSHTASSAEFPSTMPADTSLVTSTNCQVISACNIAVTSADTDIATSTENVASPSPFVNTSASSTSGTSNIVAHSGSTDVANAISTSLASSTSTFNDDATNSVLVDDNAAKNVSAEEKNSVDIITKANSNEISAKNPEAVVNEEKLKLDSSKDVNKINDNSIVLENKSKILEDKNYIGELDKENEVQSSVVEQNEDSKEEDEEYNEADDDEPDDDEIVDNPAYIPKSGKYYMHDSRNIENDIIESGPVRSRADGKWKHDRFDERSQRPKSRRELVNRYGFDIRYEDKNGEEGSAGIDRDGGRGGAIRRGFRPRRGSKIMRGSRRENQRTNQGYEQKYENQGTKRPFQQQTRNTRRNARLIRPNFNLLQRSQRYKEKTGTNQIQSHRNDMTYKDNQRSTSQNVHPNVSRVQGGKRYSTQRVANSFNEPQIPPVQVPGWTPSFVQPPIPQAVPNFHNNDIVYFDPQQQLRNTAPPVPRAKKRLEIVPPTQSTNPD